MTKIDTEAFLRDLYELREIGKFRTGVHRPTYSPQDMESRRWLIDRLTACGLEASMDGIGNVFGRHPGNGPHLLVGSHIETQNEAGWLDGALGVMAGVALARAGLPVDVIAFADEEGHFEGGFLGSRSAAPTARSCATRCKPRASPASRGCRSIRAATRAITRCTSSRARGSNKPACASAW
jgi:N-carbamoyl-L-amino-acid hydrolase